MTIAMSVYGLGFVAVLVSVRLLDAGSWRDDLLSALEWPLLVTILVVLNVLVAIEWLDERLRRDGV